MGRHRRIIAASAGALLLVAALVCAAVYARVQTVLKSSAVTSGEIPVSVQALQPAATGFDAVHPVADFQSVASFDGDLYVCGRSALFRYRDGELKQSWTVGRDFPAFPLRQLAVRTGISNPELWIATEGAGILIYDGARFRQLLPADPALRHIMALLPLRNGSVLAGTAEAGLYLSDGKWFHLFHPQFATTQVTALAGDEDGVWVGTRKDGAWLWRGGQALHVTNELPDADVLSIATLNERAWIGTPLGVSEFADGKLIRHLAQGIFAQAVAVHEGSLWMGTIDQGTFSIPLAARTARPNALAMSHADTDARAFIEVDQHLTALDETGLRELPDGNSILSASPESMAEGHVTSLHKDSRGRLWVGYFDRGLDIIGESGPKHIEDDVLFCINRIKEDAEHGMTAVGTANGLALFDAAGQVHQILDRAHGLIASHVTDLLFHSGDDGASLTIATPAGLTSMGRDGLSSVSGFQGLVNNHVYTLADVDGTLYAGTLGGISVLRNGLVQASFSTANSQLKQNWITASAVADNTLYAGTYGSGVIEFQHNGAVVEFPEFARRRIEINPNAMLATARAVYAGTSGQGIAVMMRGERRWRFVTRGLPSLNVTALDERDGELYIGTDNGLVRIAEAGLLP